MVNSEREPGNWITHHGNYEAHRFSGLSEINKDNVKDLKVAFTYAMGSAQGGGTDPVVFPFAGLEARRSPKTASCISPPVGAW